MANSIQPVQMQPAANSQVANPAVQIQQPVVQPVAEQQPEPPKKKPKWWLWIIIMIVIIGAGVAAYFFLLK